MRWCWEKTRKQKFYLGSPSWCKYFPNIFFIIFIRKYFLKYLELCLGFLAVQNSSIGDLVTHSLTHWLRTLLIVIQRATLETCELWDIWSEWWEDMTWPKKMTKTKTKTFWEHLLRAILETCDLWDICSEWWEDMTWPKKNWQRQIQRQRQ